MDESSDSESEFDALLLPWAKHAWHLLLRLRVCHLSELIQTRSMSVVFKNSESIGTSFASTPARDCA